ncbi:molybdopterin-binding protein [Pseudoroseomonas wenyumeiae]
MLPLHVTDPALAAARLEALIAGPVAPARLAVGESLGLPLAADLLLPQALPARDIAAQDGWALSAADTAGASAYAPAPLAGATWVEAGDTLPNGNDAVLPAFEVEEHGPQLTALAEAVPGDGVQPAGADAPLALLLRHAGQRLRAADLPLLAMAGIASVAVRRPRVALLPIGDEIMASPALDRTGPFLFHLLTAEGAEARILPPAGDDPASIAEALRAGAAEADLLLTLGGTGLGRRDHAAAGLALAGEVLLHGLGARPGHSAGFGQAGGRPVILVPGHPADALAGWLLLARPRCGGSPAPCRRRRDAPGLAARSPPASGWRNWCCCAGARSPIWWSRWPPAPCPFCPGGGGGHAGCAPASEGYEAGRWVEVEEI